MKLKDLKSEWSNGVNYAILNLPFICYAVQPHWKNQFEPDSSRHKFTISYKSSVSLSQPLDEEFSSISNAKAACEAHLEDFLKAIVNRLERVVSFQ